MKIDSARVKGSTRSSLDGMSSPAATAASQTRRIRGWRDRVSLPGTGGHNGSAGGCPAQLRGHELAHLGRTVESERLLGRHLAQVDVQLADPGLHPRYVVRPDAELAHPEPDQDRD